MKARVTIEYDLPQWDEAWLGLQRSFAAVEAEEALAAAPKESA
jgi:hypothetical protein